MGFVITLLVVLAAAAQAGYTARLAWQAKLRRGAVGLGFLCLACLAVPAWVYWRAR
jgi:hypothetical protein